MGKHLQFASLGVITLLLLLAGLAAACGDGLGVTDTSSGDGDSAALRDAAPASDSEAITDPAAFDGEELGALAVGGSQLQSSLDRKIIQSTSVDVEVEQVGRAFQEVIRITESSGGFVASSAFSNLDDGEAADITVRVPIAAYQSVLAQIRGMGEVSQESSDANDVTEEFTDLQARLRTLEATERRYLELLAEADGIEEILLVQDRLDGVRGRIEQAQGRVNLLGDLTDLATITAHLRTLIVAAETGGGGLDPLAAAGKAWENSLVTLLALATVAVAVGVYSWWMLPPLVISTLVYRWWMQRRAQPRAPAP